MEEHIEFESDGLTLDGILHVPDDYKAGEKRTAMLVLHGFGGSKNGGGAKGDENFNLKTSAGAAAGVSFFPVSSA